MAWLLDTNVLSELRRPKPEPRVVAFVSGCPLEQLYISVVTLSEIRFGIELVGEPDRRVDLNDWLTHQGAANVSPTGSPDHRRHYAQVAAIS
jgi:toxin FitB